MNLRHVATTPTGEKALPPTSSSVDWLASDFARKSRSLTPIEQRNLTRPTPKAYVVQFDKSTAHGDEERPTSPSSSPTAMKRAGNSPERSILSRSQSSCSNARSPLFHGSKTSKELSAQRKQRLDHQSALDETLHAAQHVGSPPLFATHGGARGIVALLRKTTALTSGQLPYPIYHAAFGEAFRDGFDIAPEKFPSNGFFQYTGDFRHSLRHGKGALTMGDGSSIVGHFDQGEIRGLGVKTFCDGATYTGEFNLGEPHGKGSYNGVSDGEYYVGEFAFGQRSGSGVLHRTFQDEKYEGEFRDNLYHGKGKLEVRNAFSLEGEFKKGLPHGFCKVHFAKNDHEFEGTFDEGFEHGENCLFVDRDCGLTYRGPMVHGARKFVPNCLVPTEVTVEGLPLEAFFVSGLGPQPATAKTDREREAACHADSHVSVYPGQTLRVEVCLAFDERHAVDSSASELYRQPTIASAAGGKKNAPKGPLKGPAIHHLITSIASSASSVRQEESGRSIVLRLGRPSAPPPSGQQQGGGGLRAEATMGKSLAAASTRAHPPHTTLLAQSTLMPPSASAMPNNSFSGAFSTNLTTSTAAFAPTTSLQLTFGDMEECAFFDEAIARASIDRFIGEFFAGKHGGLLGDRSSVVSSKKSVLLSRALSTTPPSATPGRSTRAVASLGGGGRQTLGASTALSDDDSTSRRPSSRIEASSSSPHNATSFATTTTTTRKAAKDGRTAFSVTLPPQLPPGEYVLTFVAAAEHCLKPGGEVVASSPATGGGMVAPFTIPIRLVALDFQKQKQYVRNLQGSRYNDEDDDDDDGDIFNNAPPNNAQLIDFSIPVPSVE